MLRRPGTPGRCGGASGMPPDRTAVPSPLVTDSPRHGGRHDGPRPAGCRSHWGPAARRHVLRAVLLRVPRPLRRPRRRRRAPRGDHRRLRPAHPDEPRPARRDRRRRPQRGPRRPPRRRAVSLPAPLAGFLATLLLAAAALCAVSLWRRRARHERAAAAAEANHVVMGLGMAAMVLPATADLVPPTAGALAFGALGVVWTVRLVALRHRGRPLGSPVGGDR